MKVIYRLLLVLPLRLIPLVASAQHQTADSEFCPVCHDINQSLYGLSLNPDSAADMNLPDLVSQLDSIHLFDFVARITMTLQSRVSDISPSVIKKHFLPCMEASVKAMASQNDMFVRMSMDREVTVGQCLSSDLTDDSLRALLNDFCTLAGYMAGYSKFRRQAELSGCKNWFYSNLHYIERTIYGDDVYMRSIDSVPTDCFSRLYVNFCDYITDVHQRPEMLIFSAIMNAYYAGQYKLVADNARDIMKWSLCVIPNFQQIMLEAALSDVGKKLGRDEELEEIVYEESVARYGNNMLLDAIYTGNSLVGHTVDPKEVESFEEYRAVLKAEGYKFADCWPWNCPQGYVDEDNFDQYMEYCIECAKILRLYWMVVPLIEGSQVGNQFSDAMSDYFGLDTDEMLTLISFDFAVMIYNRGGYVPMALDIIEASVNHYRNLPVWTFVPYGLADIAIVYCNLGNHARANDIIYDYLLQYVENCGFDNDFMYEDLMLTAKCAAVLGEVGKSELATELASLALSMADRLESDDDKTELLGLLCDVYYASGDYRKALELVDRSIHYDIPEDYKAWLELGKAELHYRLKNWSQAVESYRRYAGTQYQENFVTGPNFFCEIMSCAAHADDQECMRETADRYVGNIRAEIDDKLYNLSSDERERFYGIISNGNCLLDVFEASRDNEEQQSIFASCAYDYELVMKGLLLSADNQIDRMLAAYPDSLVRKRYAQMKDMAAQLDNMVLHGGDPARMSFIREGLERAGHDVIAILRRAGIEYNIVGQFHAGWREVREKLGAHDVAVEFMRLYDGENDSIDPLYVALVLREGWETPRVVELCRESALNRYVHGDQKRNRRLYNGYEVTNLWPLIWKPLQKYMTDGERVYFAVDGALNMLNIGAIRPDEEDRRTADERYVLRRVSSTRELCMKKEDSRINEAVVYGGLNYDMGDDALAEAASKYHSEGIVMSRGLSRGSSDPGLLPDGDIYEQTLSEAVDIAGMLRAHSVKTDLITGNQGVEESFKSLSGKCFELLHMATHGFYMPGQTQYQAGEGLLPPMMRSGLMMSRKKVMAEDSREDGLLLAREIADLDLSSVGLVVLSACQTAQGDISGDRVFGLQRGFKQAGVGSIVMTLWPIDSEMAKYMTTEFYGNLTAGVEKHEAFRIAQSKTKHVYPDLDWAAFIMLD